MERQFISENNEAMSNCARYLHRRRHRRHSRLHLLCTTIRIRWVEKQGSHTKDVQFGEHKLP